MPFCRVAVPKAVSVWQSDKPGTGGESRLLSGKRLLTPRHFKAVFDSPSGKVPGKNVLLLARDNGLDHPRLGLVIGKKSVKLSVERNRLKRQIRESYRLNQEVLNGWDIVIVARKGLGDLDNPELAQQFGKLWKRLARSKSRSENNAETGVADSPHA